MSSYAHLLAEHAPFAIVQKIADMLEIETYVVGGFVRDLFLQRTSKDIDIVCVGDSITLAERFAKDTGSSKVVIFKRFGTAMVQYQGWTIEFVTARKESYQCESRKPIVKAGTLEDDQKRRDFTFNALAIQLNKANFGTLIDPFDGITDLEKKIIRTPLASEETFSDDPLRMMRAIRFACQLAFQLTPATHQAIANTAHRLEIVSMERIMTEFNKILTSSQARRGLFLLDQTRLLDKILPELQALKGREVIGKHSHKDNFLHTLEVLNNVTKVSDDLWLRWAALLHDIAKPRTKRFNPKIGFTFHGHEELGARMIPRIFKRLRLPLQEAMRYVQKLVRLHLRPIILAQDIVTDSAVRRLIHDAGTDIDDLMKLCRADITSKNPHRVRLYFGNFERVEEKIAEVKASDFIRSLQPVIDGTFIMKTFDLTPSAQVGRLKKALKEAVIDGSVANERGALYQFLLKKAAEEGLTPQVTPEPDLL